mgnify:CR=1 FL=1
MKTYGLLILLLLTCFISNAQDVKRKEHKQKNNVSSVLETEKKSTNNLNHLDVKSIIVRASDFKIYMNELDLSLKCIKDFYDVIIWFIVEPHHK